MKILLALLFLFHLVLIPVSNASINEHLEHYHKASDQTQEHEHNEHHENHTHDKNGGHEHYNLKIDKLSLQDEIAVAPLTLKEYFAILTILNTYQELRLKVQPQIQASSPLPLSPDYQRNLPLII